MRARIITAIMAVLTMLILGVGTVGEGWSCIGLPS